MARLKQTLSASQAATRKFSGNLSRRIYRNVSRHVAGMPAVAIPYVGAGVTAAMTGLDIREGCEALRELMVAVDSTCSHVAFRRMLSKNDIDELTDISRRARECYQDRAR